MQAFSDLDVCFQSSNVCICYEISVSLREDCDHDLRWIDYLNSTCLLILLLRFCMFRIKRLVVHNGRLVHTDKVRYRYRTGHVVMGHAQSKYLPCPEFNNVFKFCPHSIMLDILKSFLH